MASGSSAYSTKAGYNQNGGAYYVTLATVAANFLTYAGGSNSGGATTVGTFTPYSYATDGANNTSSLLSTNKVIKDMGKTVVSAGRTFRKFQAVVAQTLNTGGISGQPAGTVNPGYLTGYLELPREGNGVVTNAIARLG